MKYVQSACNAAPFANSEYLLEPHHVQVEGHAEVCPIESQV